MYLMLNMMLKWILSTFGVLATACAALGQVPDWSEVETFISNHCIDCHDDDVQKGELNLDTLSRDLRDPLARERWVSIFHRVKDDEMPPTTRKKRPNQTEREALLKLLEPRLVRADKAEREERGRVNVRRLTRREYTHTIHDLLGIDIPFDEILPEDTLTHGFETVAAGQQLSPLHLARFLEAADQALAEAFQRAAEGDERWEKTLSPKDIGKNGMGNYRGLDIRDGMAIAWRHTLQFHGRIPQTRVPRSGWYEITLKGLQAINPPVHPSLWGTLRSGACESNQPLLFHIDAVEATRTPRDATYRAWIRKNHLLEFRPVEAGLKYAPLGASGGNVSYKKKDHRKAGLPGLAIRGIHMRRIHPNAKASEVRARLFPRVSPEEMACFEHGGDYRALVRRTVRIFANRAFRRPVDDPLVKPYLQLAEDVLDEPGGNPMLALRTAYRAILCSPRFLTLQEPAGKLDAHALASRLSYALWNSKPDANLRAAADDGSLLESAVLRAQVQRMASHPNFERFIDSFSDQWLSLREIDATMPDQKRFWQWDPAVHDASMEETRMFLAELFRTNESVTHLIQSDFATVNERLARHYQFFDKDKQYGGIGLKPGHGTQRVKLTPGLAKKRSGIATQAAILKLTANGTTTSPVIRGVWISERLLGIHVPPPPPNVPAVEPDIRGAVSIRDQIEKHRDSVACASCHAKIDPAGLALEHYNPIGLWREWYGTPKKSAKIDSSGITAKGKAFADTFQWKARQLEDPEQLARGVVGHLLTYATGAPPRFSDRAEIERILGTCATSDFRLRDLLVSAFDSTIFRSK